MIHLSPLILAVLLGAGGPEPLGPVAPSVATELAWVRAQAAVLEEYGVAGTRDAVRGGYPPSAWVLHDRGCYEVPLRAHQGLLRGTIQACHEPEPGTWRPLGVEVVAGQSLGLMRGEDYKDVAPHLVFSGPSEVRYADTTHNLELACWGGAKSTRVCEDGSTMVCDVCQQLRLLKGAQVWASEGPKQIIADFTRTCKDPCPWGMPRTEFNRLAAFVKGATWVWTKSPGPTLFGSRQACVEASKERKRGNPRAIDLRPFAQEVRSCDDGEVQDSFAEQKTRCKPSRNTCEATSLCLRQSTADAFARCTEPPSALSEPYRLPLAGPGGVRCKEAFGHHLQNAFSLGLVPVASGGTPRVLAARAGWVDTVEPCGPRLCPDEDGSVVVVVHGDGSVTSYGGVQEVKVGEGGQVEEGDTLGTGGGAIQFTVYGSAAQPSRAHPFSLTFQPRDQDDQPRTVAVGRGCGGLDEPMFPPPLPSDPK